jgi:hypothetical protein
VDLSVKIAPLSSGDVAQERGMNELFLVAKMSL